MAKTTKKEAGKLKVGFAGADITPPLPFPLAGMADKKGRNADEVRDPLMVRATAFSDGQKTSVLVSADLLLITAVLREDALKRVKEKGVTIDGALISATHTHSSTGGYWDTQSAPLFMGPYDPAIFDRIAQGIADAIESAVADLKPATLHFGKVETVGLNYNRRHENAPIDRELCVVTAKRTGRTKDITIVTFGAHPVVVGFRKYNTASADYPGKLVEYLERSGQHAMFVVGPVGGVNVLFPEGPMDLEFHLDLLSKLLIDKMELAIATQTPVADETVDFGSEDIWLGMTLPKLFPDSKAWADVLLVPLRLWVKNFGKKGGMQNGRHTQVCALRVGDVVFGGMPADLGAGVGLAAKKIVDESKMKTAVIASQTGDYVGYVHMPEDYQLMETGDKAAMWMNIYENAMAFGGRQTGAKMVDSFTRIISKFNS